MSTTPVGPCSPQPPPPWWLNPHHPGLVRAKVIIVIIVLGFATALVVLGYDLQAALVGAAGGVLIAGEAAKRVLGSGSA